MLVIWQTLCVFLIAAALLSAGTMATSVLLPRRGASLFLCGTVTASLWIAAVVFHALAFAGLFRLPVVILLSCLPPFFFLHGTIRRQVRQDLQNVKRAFKTLADELIASRWGLALVPLFLIALLRAARSLVSPPLGHDALMYHLYKAGRWVREGRMVFETGPDAWSYFEWFPWLGSTFQAWAMLPFRGDQLVGFTGFIQWLLLIAGLYGFVRQMQAQKLNALFVSAAIAALPTCLGLMTTGYIDHVAMALWAVGLAFVARLIRASDSSAGIAGIAALSLAAGLKFTYVPFLGMAALIVLPSLFRRPTAFICALVATLPAALVFGTTWIKTGSPTYPFTLPGFGSVFPGNDQLAAVMSGALTEPWLGKPTVTHWFPRLFWLTGRDGWPHVNFGVSGLILVPLGLAGWIAAVRSRPKLSILVLPAMTLLLITVSFLSPGYAGQRGAFANTAGRLLAPAAAAVVIFAAFLPRRVVLSVCTVSVLVSTLTVGTRGFSAPDWLAVGEFAALSALAVIVCSLAFLVFRRTQVRKPAGLTLVFLCTFACLAWSADVAARYRHAIHAQVRAENNRAYDFHPMGWTRCWPLWRAIDQPQPLRIALTAGWTPEGTGVGHNWLRYPYLGSRLQNTVMYVPISESGEVIDYWNANRIEAEALYDAWLARLRKANVTYVVPLDPYPPEFRWMSAHPEDFERLSPPEADGCVIFALRR